jgi:hypothetical protein
MADGLAYPNFRAFAEAVLSGTVRWLEVCEMNGASWRSHDGDRYAILSGWDGNTQLRFAGPGAPPPIDIDPDERGAAENVTEHIKAYIDRPT